MPKSKMLNFRCPVELLEAIDKVGQQRYPTNNKSGCDRSKTLIDVCMAGVEVLMSGAIKLPIQDPDDSVTKQDLELLKSAVIAEISRQVNEAKKLVS